jgi:6-phosphogluconolactonase/glucosamine-6-phosphate isomerase/deaminase
MSQVRAPSRRTTRATQKVQEAEPMWSKSKGKGKAKVIEDLLEEAQREKLEKLKAKRVVIQEMIDNLEG